MPDPQPPRARASSTWILVAAVLAAAGTARLGVWQLDRAHQKLALQAQITQQTQLPALNPQALARDPVQAEQQLLRRITLQGQWIDAATVFLDNRTMDGRSGFFVLTPLQLPSGEAVLVQRGWAPRDLRDRSLLPALAPQPGPVQVQGRLAAWPSKLYDMGQAGAGTLRQNLDPAAYAREFKLQLLPLTLQLLEAPQSTTTPAPLDDGLLRHWWIPAADVQKHYGYAAQWFALSALIAGLYVWFQLLRPRLQRPH